MFTGLAHGTYNVSVVATDSTGARSESAAHTVSAEVAKGPGETLFVFETVGKEYSITITWSGIRPPGMFQYRQDTERKDVNGDTVWSPWIAWYTSTDVSSPLTMPISGLTKGTYQVRYVEITGATAPVTLETTAQVVNNLNQRAANPSKPKITVDKQAAMVNSVTLKLKLPTKTADIEALGNNIVYEIAYWDAKTKKIGGQIPDAAKTWIAVTKSQMEEGVTIDGLEGSKSYSFAVTAKNENGVTIDVKTAGRNEKPTTVTVKASTAKYLAAKKNGKQTTVSGAVTLNWKQSATTAKMPSGNRFYEIALYDTAAKKYLPEIISEFTSTGTGTFTSTISAELLTVTKKYTFEVREIIKDSNDIKVATSAVLKITIKVK